MRLFKGLIVILLLPLSLIINAATLDEGVSALNAGNHQKSLKILLPLANKGNAKAQYHVANMYVEGQGVATNILTALKWYKMAAKQGHSASMFMLGSIYFEGKGVTIDQSEAYKWFYLAKTFGDSRGENLQTALARGMTDSQVNQAKQMADTWRKQNGL